MNVLNVVTTSMCFLLAAVFVVAASHKLADIKQFKKVVDDYQILPSAMVGWLSVVLPIIELLAACALCAASFYSPLGYYSVALSLALMSIYTAALAKLYFEGRALEDCGCGGSANQPLSLWPVLRNIGLMLICLYLLASFSFAGVMPMFSVLVIPFALVLSLVYWITDGLMMNTGLIAIVEKHYD